MAASVEWVNQMKTRLRALGLLDRAFTATTDDELVALVDALDDEHREGLAQLIGVELDAGRDQMLSAMRTTIASGRLDGGMEGVAIVLTDACLAQCIEALGDHAERPSTDQLLAVLPDLIADHGVAATRIMLAATVAGEAPAAPIIRDLLKHHETLRLPEVELRSVVPTPPTPDVDDAERAAIRERRRQQREARQAAARQRREQSRRDRGRA